jgi:hypothetical protein
MRTPAHRSFWLDFWTLILSTIKYIFAFKNSTRPPGAVRYESARPLQRALRLQTNGSQTAFCESCDQTRAYTGSRASRSYFLQEPYFNACAPNPRLVLAS